MSDKSTHASDCDWHVDQYPWECTCGLIARKKAMDEADREAVRAEMARAIEIELSMCAIANAEAPTEWIDGFEFAWKRVKETLGDWKSEAEAKRRKSLPPQPE